MVVKKYLLTLYVLCNKHERFYESGGVCHSRQAKEQNINYEIFAGDSSLHFIALPMTELFVGDPSLRSAAFGMTGVSSVQGGSGGGFASSTPPYPHNARCHPERSGAE